MGLLAFAPLITDVMFVALVVFISVLSALTLAALEMPPIGYLLTGVFLGACFLPEAMRLWSAYAG